MTGYLAWSLCQQLGSAGGTWHATTLIIFKIYANASFKGEMGDRIQINDEICEQPFSSNANESSDIQAYMEIERTTGAPTYRDEKEIPFMTTSLKCDKFIEFYWCNSIFP